MLADRRSSERAQTMLQLVNAGHKSLADYATIATRGLMDEIRRLAEPLAGKRVVHLSATAFGGGVAEINYTLIPLMQDSGLEVEWRIIRGAEEFYNVTKTIHNALQGNPQGLDDEQRETFRRYQELNAQEFEDDYDFVVVHDPQPVGMIDYVADSRARWVWRGHIDFSTPNQSVFGDVLLALVGSMAHDDPEGWDYYNQTVEYAAGDPDIYILSNLNNVGSVEVNAFQVHSAAVIQKSIREGFGLTVTEALWKTRPTVAGRVGGIVAQIQDGETGWLVSSPEECAQACLEILQAPGDARRRALRGKEYVRRHFLTPRLLRDWLVLFNRLLGNDTSGAELAVV